MEIFGSETATFDTGSKWHHAEDGNSAIKSSFIRMRRKSTQGERHNATEMRNTNEMGVGGKGHEAARAKINNK